MAVVQAQPIELVLQTRSEHIDIEVVTAECDPVDASFLTLAVLDCNGTEIFTEDFFNPPGGGQPGTGRIKKVDGVIGRYFFPFGEEGTETATVGDFLFNWSVETATGTERADIIQTVKVASARAFSLLPYFRLQIDKAAKIVEPNLGVFLGYTDANLMMYLEAGVQWLNIYGQEQFAFTVDTFPAVRFRALLLMTSMYWGLLSQTVYAIDVDQDFSDQGYSFNLSRFPKLSQFANTLSQQIERQAQLFKFTFVSTGSIKTEMGPSFRLNQLLQAAPNGATFRNIFTVGG